MRAQVSGAWAEVEGGRARIGGAWKRLAKVRAYVSGAWKDVAVFVPALSAAISPDSVSASRVGPGAVTTATVTATPTGGMAPYTYAWTRTGGVGSATNASSASTAFTATLGTGDDTFGDFLCTVTDSLGTTATAVITAFFTSTDPGGF